MMRLPVMYNVLALALLGLLAMVIALSFNAFFDLGEAAWGIVGIVIGGIISPIPMIVKFYADSNGGK